MIEARRAWIEATRLRARSMSMMRTLTFLSYSYHLGGRCDKGVGELRHMDEPVVWGVRCRQRLRKAVRLVTRPRAPYLCGGCRRR